MVGEVTEAGGTFFLQDPTGHQDTFLAGNNGAEQRLPAGLRPYTFHNWHGKPMYDGFIKSRFHSLREHFGGP
jgi:hypothetical protein